ncbi:MAG: hypothetical protein ACHQX3_00225 [Nitrospirales bacterium]|jgi:hypothetical protein
MHVNPSECCHACGQTIPPIAIPGVPGNDGAPGATGAAGQNSYTITTANFNIPGVVNTNVTFLVANSAPLGIGTNIFASDGANVGTFKVISKPSAQSVEGQWLQYPGDSAGGTQINSGALVGPAGYLPTVPVDIANGGTGAATKAAAQAALGLGQTITEFNGTALAYAITAPTPATITGATVVAPAAGLYLVVAFATVEFRGTTFAASRTITLKTRNTTAGADISTAAKTTGIITTTGYPSLDYHTPFKVATLALNDVVALQIGIDVVETAGTSEVMEASIALIPLALT